MRYKKHIIDYNWFLVVEILGISDDVSKLTEFIYNKFNGENLYLTNIPLKLYKPINSITIKNFKSNEYSALFNLSKSKETINGLDLIFTFQKNITKDIIQHEVQHAYQFSINSREKSLKKLNDIRSARYSKMRVLTGTKRADIIDNFIYLIYFLNNVEIEAFVNETYRKLKESNCIKRNFKELLSNSYAYQICKSIENYNIFNEFSYVDKETKVKFFTYFKNEEHRLKKLKKDTFLKRIIRDLKFIFDKDLINNKELFDYMKKWDRYIESQNNKLMKKLHRLYDLF